MPLRLGHEGLGGRLGRDTFNPLVRATKSVARYGLDPLGPGCRSGTRPCIKGTLLEMQGDSLSVSRDWALW